MMSSGTGISVQPAPTDTVSELVFSPTSDLLAASSWDSKVRIYQIQNFTSVLRGSYTHDDPVLSCAWSLDGTKLFSGGADKCLRVMDLNTGQTGGFVAHDLPIRCVRWNGINSTVVTGSWDKKLRYWDLRQSQPVATIELPERCYALDIAKSLMVVGTADRHVCLVDLTNHNVIAKTIQSPLKWQTRCIACFPDGTGYVIGSIEGRASIQYIEERRIAESFTFKCHRTDTSAYPLNSIVFHSILGVVATGGGDSAFNIWNKDTKQRCKSFLNLGAPVTSISFSTHSETIAYSLGYDWSKGYENYLPSIKTGIFLQKIARSDLETKTGLLKKR